MERDLGIGMAIIAGTVLSFWLLLLTAGPGWILEAPVAIIMVLVIVGGVAYSVALYRRRLII